MSFGFSAGDFLTVGQFAWQLYRSCKGASAEFDEIAREVITLHTGIKELEDEATDPDSILNRTGIGRKKELETLLQNCMTVLRQLQRLVGRYKSLGTNQKKAWDLVRFGTEGVGAIREKLTFHAAGITLFLTSLGTGSLGRIEKKLDDLVNEIRSGKREPSILTLGEEEEVDDAVWRTLKSDLVDEGFTTQEVELHKTAIREHLRFLNGEGDLQEINSGCHEEVESTSRLETPAKVGRGPVKSSPKLSPSPTLTEKSYTEMLPGEGEAALRKHDNATSSHTMNLVEPEKSATGISPAVQPSPAAKSTSETSSETSSSSDSTIPRDTGLTPDMSNGRPNLASSKTSIAQSPQPEDKNEHESQPSSIKRKLDNDVIDLRQYPAKTDPLAGTVTCIVSLPLTLEDIFYGKKIVKRVLQPTYNGSHYDVGEKTLEFGVFPGTPAGTSIVFRDFSQLKHGRRLNINFVINEIEHPMFTRQENNLHHKLRISLMESLTGVNLDLKSINGQAVPIRVPLADPQKPEIFSGFGMPDQNNPRVRGSLIITFEVMYPKVLSRQWKEDFDHFFTLNQAPPRDRIFSAVEPQNRRLHRRLSAKNLRAHESNERHIRNRTLEIRMPTSLQKKRSVPLVGLKYLMGRSTEEPERSRRLPGKKSKSFEARWSPEEPERSKRPSSKKSKSFDSKLSTKSQDPSAFCDESDEDLRLRIYPNSTHRRMLAWRTRNCSEWQQSQARCVYEGGGG